MPNAMTADRVLPRPEYPRPQFQRAEWLCLNGTWAFAFDDEDRGREAGWAEQFTREAPAGRIVVPFPYQAPRSGIGDRTVHPVMWYRREFTYPAPWRSRRVLLHFGAVDFRAEVWLNGRRLGDHEGGYTPFSFDITTLLRDSANILAVRCEDSPSEEQPRGKQDGESHRAYQFTATSGIWQTVWLEPVGPASSTGTRDAADSAIGVGAVAAGNADPDAPYLAGCRIVPDLAAGGFRLLPQVAGGDATGLRLHVEASLAGAPAGTAAFDASAGGLLSITQPHLWTPDTPHLYDLRLTLLWGEAIIDEVDAYAGLREVAIRGREILLNGLPIYQRQVLDQGYWPDGIYTAPTDDALREDVRWIKRLGFNGVRKHQKVEDPRWLYWCDRLGLLVWEEMASNYLDTPRARDWLRREWRDVMRRDVNHPCIVTWVPFNETWGVRDLAVDRSQQAHVAAVVADTRAIDPTRPVVDNSGWSHVDTDIADSHHYEPAADLFLAAWRAFHHGDGPQRGRILRSWEGNHQGRTWYGAGYAKPLFADGSAYAGQPILVSEWGGFFLAGHGEVAPILQQRRGVEPDEAAFLARYREMIAAFDSLPDLAGDCWTQFTDIEDEPNGLLTEDRRPKVDVEAIAAVNQARFQR